MWNELVDAALSVVHAHPQFALHTRADLLYWVMKTGYGGLQPQNNTAQLMQVYGGNLMNSGARGPTTGVLVNLIGGGIAKFVQSNTLAPFTFNQLAQRCFEHAQQTGLEFVRAPNRNKVYLQELQELGRVIGMPAGLERRILPKVLHSLVQFGDLLQTKYGGKAELFHQGFGTSVPGGNWHNDFPQTRLEEIRNFPLVGVATGMNFLKDTQVPAFAPADVASAEAAFDTVKEVQAGWLVKPDMHVLRLMLWITGRAQTNGITPQDLVHLNQNDAKQFYANCPPCWNENPGYVLGQTQRKADRGLWDCIEDIYFIAVDQNIAPLGIDRVLYLIGSGSYRAPIELQRSQADRYATITGKPHWCRLLKS